MSLPDWLEPLPDAEAMGAVDAWASEEGGVPSLELMESAGMRVARMVPAQGSVAVVCGRGNNGGDGYVVARVLRDAGRDVRVLHVGELPTDGDAAHNLERLPGDAPRPFTAEALDGCAVVVDALLGTGFSGEPREEAAGAIAAVNASGAEVVAVDVPSGVDASSGEIAGEAVRAGLTVTFHAAKPGLWLHPGKEHVGELFVADIGIPAEAPVRADHGLIGRGVLDALPRRSAGSTKFSSGHVLVAGGSRGMTGAPCLAAQAAMRAGAGYVTALVPASLEAIFEVKLTEVMTAALPDHGGSLKAAAADAVLQRTGRGGALVLGPGLGREDEALAFARDVAQRAEVAIVVDADGLNAHAGRLADLAGRRAPTVLTPHAGELGRLLGVESDDVVRRRLHHARAAAEAAGAVIVLKGDDTIVAAPGGPVAVSPGGAPALASAGTGDVLAGTIGAMLAHGLDPFRAACAGVYAHLLAGRSLPPEGAIASDVIAALPGALVE